MVRSRRKQMAKGSRKNKDGIGIQEGTIVKVGDRFPTRHYYVCSWLQRREIKQRSRFERVY